MGFLETFQNPSMLHAAVVHLPIVFALLGVPLIYVLAVFQQRTELLRWTTVGFYVLTALFSYFALISGRGSMDRIPNDGTVPRDVWTLVGRHEEMGEKVWMIALIVAAALALSAVPVRAVRQAFTGIGMLAGIALAVWVTVLGHFGGTLVYRHGIGTPAVELMKTAHAAAPSADPASPPSDPAPGPSTASTLFPSLRPIDLEAAKKISFAKDVAPILKERCEECHNPDKMRGDFDTTSIAAMREGGKKGGPGIVPGKPDESSLVKYIRGELQPQMPKGEDPLTDDELHVIRQWIAAGAIDDTAGAPPSPTSASPAAAIPSTEPKPEQPAAEAPAVTSTPTEQAQAAPASTASDSRAAPTVDELLFSGGPEDLLVKRRNYRLSLVAKPPAPPETTLPVNNDIDRFIVAQWQSIDPAFTGQLCDDSTFARRVYLDIIGAIPTQQEARDFVNDTAQDKRVKLIDTLLQRNTEYAANWTPFWEDALCSNGNHQGGVGTRGNYRSWIFDSFRANKPYDVMTAELLDPHMPNHPDRFVLRQDHTRILKSAADTAQVFLGTQMKCASCHNHFDNREWPQRRFYGFAGYFAEKDLELIKCEAHTNEYIPTGFVFDLPGAPKDVPKSIDERAARIAQLLIDPCNPRFSKTIVNRLWKRFLGTGLFEPADNYRDDTPPSHPELLEWLAYDFMANGYDIKHTVRLILTSRTYQLAYNPALEDHFDIAKPAEPRYFRSPHLRRMTAEQLLDSIKVALGEKLVDERREYRRDESTPLTRALGRPATRNEVSTARAEDSAVVQTLELLNGDEYHDRIYNGEFVFAAAQKGRQANAYDGVMDDLYWSVLGRAPAENERAAGVEFLTGAPVDWSAPNIVDAPVLDEALPGGATPDGSNGANSWTQVHGPDAPVFSGGASWKLSAPQPVPVPTEPEASAPDAGASNAKTALNVERGDVRLQLAASIGPAVAVLAEDEPPTQAATSTPADASAAPPSPAPVVVEQSIAGLSQPINVNADDILYAYVYLDPNDPPRSIMLQWKEGDSWGHRAYWGEDVSNKDGAEGPAKHAMGALPEPGKWVRLEVPALDVKLGRAGQQVSGISIIQAGGTAYWDKAGVLRSPQGGPVSAVGDAFWALLTSPEFQYIR